MPHRLEEPNMRVHIGAVVPDPATFSEEREFDLVGIEIVGDGRFHMDLSSAEAFNFVTTWERLILEPAARKIVRLFRGGREDLRMRDVIATNFELPQTGIIRVHCRFVMIF